MRKTFRNQVSIYATAAYSSTYGTKFKIYSVNNGIVSVISSDFYPVGIRSKLIQLAQLFPRRLIPLLEFRSITDPEHLYFQKVMKYFFISYVITPTVELNKYYSYKQILLFLSIPD